MRSGIATWLTKGLVLIVLATGLTGCQTKAPSRSTISGEPATLRSLYGLAAPSTISSDKTALLLVDYQREFVDGDLPVPGAQQAIAHAAALRHWAHEKGIFVVEVQNVSSLPTSPVFRSGSPEVAIVPELRPGPDDFVLTKSMAGAFSRTDLDRILREKKKVDTVIVAGFMTHLAVDTTARDASVLGYKVIVASDACSTRALPSALGGGSLDAATVHRAALASLADRFADVLTTAQIEDLAVND